ncbi:LapA family protein [Ligilactobacillus saerimneri]|uniref:LapA family protein n=1 Tax=Ligilactobacillus saerimneri TaxID=228229 RepID=UPI00242D79B2|nr:LapA family protein [Ligilactobacillus saerimneri]
MKKQINLIIGFVLVLIIAVFSYLNRQLVTINFGLVATTMPLIVVLIACVLLGIILATLFTANSMHKMRKKIADQEERLQALLRGRRSPEQQTPKETES